jgi:formiminotetrahydrofolate cyclodeaminase
MHARTIRPVAESHDYIGVTVRDLLDSIAAEAPAPAGGSVAAIVLAAAAALAAMAARFSREHWDGAAGAVAQAERLRGRAEPLAQADAVAYERALAALRQPRDGDPDVRNAAIGLALEGAAAVPLEIAEVAVDVAELAATVAEHGNPNLRGDAAAAAELAVAAARIGAGLVEINLGATKSDERIVRGTALVAAAVGAAARARDAALS